MKKKRSYKYLKLQNLYFVITIFLGLWTFHLTQKVSIIQRQTAEVSNANYTRLFWLDISSYTDKQAKNLNILVNSTLDYYLAYMEFVRLYNIDLKSGDKNIRQDSRLKNSYNKLGLIYNNINKARSSLRRQREIFVLEHRKMGHSLDVKNWDEIMAKEAQANSVLNDWMRPIDDSLLILSNSVAQRQPIRLNKKVNPIRSVNENNVFDRINKLHRLFLLYDFDYNFNEVERLFEEQQEELPMINPIDHPDPPSPLKGLSDEELEKMGAITK